ncbi:YbaK family protein [Heyndrickxia acidiproducens]|uniref:YbaK family protein n=1 Tax=Heyndrickxia acidiproducens TaxID=1121084 RepID=UPI00037D519A|nr:YbaK family protein [Heyndrickxia acidiproducens]
MNEVITTLSAKRRERQIKYERNLLRQLPIESLKKSFQSHFGSIRINGGTWMEQGVEEGCYDVAIEAYLLGGQFSRFGYYGETPEETKQRCEKEIGHITDTLYNFWLYWTYGNNPIQESINYTCEQFVDYWWTQGFKKGEQRRKLRLH